MSSTTGQKIDKIPTPQHNSGKIAKESRQNHYTINEPNQEKITATERQLRLKL